LARPRHANARARSRALNFSFASLASRRLAAAAVQTSLLPSRRCAGSHPLWACRRPARPAGMAPLCPIPCIGQWGAQVEPRKSWLVRIAFWARTGDLAQSRQGVSHDAFDFRHT